MVQSSQAWARHDPTGTCGGNSASRCLLRKAKMRAVFVVVADVLREQPFQVAFIECDDVVQQVPVGASHPALRRAIGMSVQLRRMAMLRFDRFRVTHPYHPLFQQEFELVSYRQDWGEDRVWFQGKLGRLHSLPTSWTDAGAVDPFVALAAGRSLFRVADLIDPLTPEQRKICGMHKERGPETIETVVKMFAGHDLNHFQQIEQILASRAK